MLLSHRSTQSPTQLRHLLYHVGGGHALLFLVGRSRYPVLSAIVSQLLKLCDLL